MGEYAILKSVPVNFDFRSDDNHIFIHTKARDSDYSLAVNVQSNIRISRLYFCVKYFSLQGESVTANWLQQWLPAPEGILRPKACDGEPFVYNESWFLPHEMCPAEDEETFQNRNAYTKIDLERNDLARTLVKLVKRTLASPEAFLVTAGVLWGPKKERDWTFGFFPAQGLHDIHENGNGEDGAVFFYEPLKQRAAGVFTRFQ